MFFAFNVYNNRDRAEGRNYIPYSTYNIELGEHNRYKYRSNPTYDQGKFPTIGLGEQMSEAASNRVDKQYTNFGTNNFVQVVNTPSSGRPVEYVPKSASLGRNYRTIKKTTNHHISNNLEDIINNNPQYRYILENQYLIQQLLKGR